MANASVSGSLAATCDVDFYRVSLPAGKTLTAQLIPNAASAFIATIYTAAAGSALAASPSAGTGGVGVVVYSNKGSAASSYLAGMTRKGGAAGSYSLKLTQ